MLLRILAVLAWAGWINAAQYDIYNGPTLDNSDSVQFFYLEAPFPFNAPENIVQAAGSNFQRFGVSHAGLGIWDTTTDEKFTIEFVSKDYVGALLPKLENGQIAWANEGSIVITSPLVESLWMNSRLITTTSGSAWTQLVTFLQANTHLFTSYQPVTGLYLNGSRIDSSVEYSSNDIQTGGQTVISAVNSFAFVDALVTQLGSYGSDLGAFLPIYVAAFDYIAASPARPAVVDLQNTHNNEEVYQWYSDLTTCYKSVFQETEQQTSNGAQYFLTSVSDCYGDFAYVYASPSSVYNLSLANVSNGQYVTPLLNQYIYTLPPDDTGSNQHLEPIDYIVIAVVFIAIVYGIYYFITKFFGKKERRRVSFEGERIAARTVENITEGLDDDEQEHRAYFHGKNSKSGWSRGTLFTNPMRPNTPESSKMQGMAESESV